MAATYEALQEHGYADLTIKQIGESFPKSTSLIYHHYEGKDELLRDFLGYLLEHFETSVPKDEYPDARAHLEALLAHLLADELPPERESFTAAMVELRGQAASDPDYREHFDRSTAYFHDRLVQIITDGQAEGVFRDDVDPASVAALLLATIDGTRFQRVTTEDAVDVGQVRAELEAYVETRLVEETG